MFLVSHLSTQDLASNLDLIILMELLILIMLGLIGLPGFRSQLSKFEFWLYKIILFFGNLFIQYLVGCTIGAVLVNHVGV